MLEYGYSKAAICRKLKCNPKTLDDHCGECQKNNVLFEGYIHIYLCIDILCQWKIPNWQYV